MNGFRAARQRDIKKNSNNVAELGTVTSSGVEINAEGAGEYREVPLSAPFGIRWNPPSGIDIELIKNWGSGQNVIAIGTVIDKEVPPGELELFSLGGANLKLKNDGSIVLNEHLIIKKDGTMEKI